MVGKTKDLKTSKIDMGGGVHGGKNQKSENFQDRCGAKKTKTIPIL
jgi:hypothetical protein